MNKKTDILEWYEGIPQVVVTQEQPTNDNHSMLGFNHPAVENKPEQPAQEVKNVENFAELYKAVAIVRALENKIIMLSDIFTMEPDKKTALKTEIKELAKKIGEVVSGI